MSYDTTPVDLVVNRLNESMKENRNLLKLKAFYDIDKFHWAESTLGKKRPHLAVYLFNTPSRFPKKALEYDVRMLTDLPIGTLFPITNAHIEIGYIIELPRISSHLFPWMIVSDQSRPVGYYTYREEEDVKLYYDSDHLQVYCNADYSNQIVIGKTNDILNLVV